MIKGHEREFLTWRLHSVLIDRKNHGAQYRSAVSKSLIARADWKIRVSTKSSNSSVVNDNRRIHRSFPTFGRDSFASASRPIRATMKEMETVGRRFVTVYPISRILRPVCARPQSPAPTNDYQDRIRICAVFTGGDRATATTARRIEPESVERNVRRRADN